MIGTISPLVQGARSQWWRSVASLVAGSVAGGAVVFACLGSFGSVVVGGLPPLGRWGIIGLVGIVLAAREFGLIRLPLPTVHRSVPPSWWIQRGAIRGAFAYGFVLGMGVTTVIPFGSFYLIAGCAFLAGDPLYSLGLGVAYGAARAFPVLGTSYLVGRSDRQSTWQVTSVLTDQINAWEGHARWLNAVAAGIFAGAAATLAAWPLWS
jgi:hypothetical protein